jgi:hypothetical protein
MRNLVRGRDNLVIQVQNSKLDSCLEERPGHPTTQSTKHAPWYAQDALPLIRKVPYAQIVKTLQGPAMRATISGEPRLSGGRKFRSSDSWICQG